MTSPYRSLFVGTLVQESFLSVGGVDDPDTMVDSPFCLDGQGRPILRGTGLAGALIATLRRCLGSAGPGTGKVPDTITGSKDGRTPSVWRFFNGHLIAEVTPAYRQHVAIDERTGAAATGALFSVATLPPETRWTFLLEVDTARDRDAAEHARTALGHWVAGRCLLGREVARGLGWLRLENLHEYCLTQDRDVDRWPDSKRSEQYRDCIEEVFSEQRRPVDAANMPPPGWIEITGSVTAGAQNDGYGIDSLSIGGHASEELAADWDERYLAPDGLTKDKARALFDPDFAVVTMPSPEKGGRIRRTPYIPGSSLRGPLRHALTRLLRARAQDTTTVAETLFGTPERSAKLLIRDALPDQSAGAPEIQLGLLMHHAEDEFTAGAYGSALFNRVAVMQGRFGFKMVVEDATDPEMRALKELLKLAKAGQIGIGGGQWRGHGWLQWEIDEPVAAELRRLNDE